MKTKLELPEDLVRELEIRAAEQGRKLDDLFADLLRLGLSQPAARQPVRRRVQLPLVVCAHEARPEVDLTPDRVAEILLAQEVERALGPT